MAWRMLNASMIWEKLRDNAKNPTPKDAERAQARKHLRELARSGTLPLLTAIKHAEISEAAVLADLIRG
jgi:uncharacterized protein YeaO (DUF488 family)